ncbi:TPA: tRNA (N(6)-L-threonylcarbamoyladenosine(37)-C(2))-methylthiotransferase MtaB [Candidatus Poribacteria bacterium]|nr:tRNA (N(6)-L-threonylcarbamoyladenosine(37)-C(2))-methylthiotransferase MtaB [Candidatus Poribacteria bacterium]
MIELKWRAAFYTFGCKVNQYETQAMRQIMEKAGFHIVPEGERADIHIINTCTVTGISDRKARKLIRHIHRLHPEAFIVVTGCYAERAAREISSIEGVGLILGNREKEKIADRIATALGIKTDLPCEGRLQVERFDGQTRATVKVEDGCDSFCAYCIIPFVRGPVRSRPINEAVAEVERLALAGHREIVVTGIHLGAYGRDWGGEPSLVDLLGRIKEVDGIERVRLSSLEPMDVTDELIALMSSDPKFAHHLHISLQSGSDRILKLMRRNYTADQFAEIVDKARAAMPDIGITTDIIVGFPGEREEDFRASYEFAEKMRFSRIHVFRFSPRPGTPAARMSDRVPPNVIKRRSEEMIALGRRLMSQFAESLVETRQKVLLEEESETGMLSGFTGNYVRAIVKAPLEMKGRMAEIFIEDHMDEKVIGRIEGRRS